MVDEGSETAKEETGPDGATRRTPEERARADRDARLMRGMMARDGAVTREGFVAVEHAFAMVARRHAKGLLHPQRFPDACQSVLALLLRWIEAGDKLHENESILDLTERLVLQVAKKMKRDARWAYLSFALEEHPARSLARTKLEAAANESAFAFHRYPNPERQARAEETARWIDWAKTLLAPEDRRVLEAIKAVDAGESPSLGEALGVSDGAARVRHRRLKERLANLAVREGNPEMARRLAGKTYAEALEALFVAEPGADHRVEEILLLRDGELETAERIELERHIAECIGCRRTRSVAALIDEGLDAMLLWPLPPFDVGRVLDAPRPVKPGTGASTWVGLTLVLLAAISAAAWWLLRSPAPPPRPIPPPLPPRAIPVQAQQQELYMAPTPRKPANTPAKPDVGK